MNVRSGVKHTNLLDFSSSLLLDVYRYGDCSSASVLILVGTYLILSFLYMKLVSNLFKK